MPNYHERIDRQKIRIETKIHQILAIRGEIQLYQAIMLYDSEDTDDGSVHLTICNCLL
jgi:hypothetical protein